MRITLALIILFTCGCRSPFATSRAQNEVTLFAPPPDMTSGWLVSPELRLTPFVSPSSGVG